MVSPGNEAVLRDLNDLFKMFAKKSFEAGPCEESTPEYEITKKCEDLFKKDYTLIELDNTNGVLSPRYPSRIFIPEYEHGYKSSNNSKGFSSSVDNAPSQNSSISNSLNQNSPSGNTAQLLPQCSSASSSAAPSNPTPNTIYEDLCDINKIRELIPRAKYARCRQRFVVPVIMCHGKYICRSATLSINAETYGRKAVNYAYDCIIGTNYSEGGNHAVDNENNDENEDSLLNQALNEPSPFSYEDVIKTDIQLLESLQVKTIVDLMVENRKVKYFVSVSSSEKADPENRYKDFALLSLPYPGCEFFKNFRDNNYMAKNLYYNWNQPFNDANISLPTVGAATELNINWNDYKSWDLVLITQNYIKACLKYIQEGKSGLLVHCISGWDRTPLFISLLRLSLWADGLIHRSLNAYQITYLTIAYDWYLFGHQLPDRHKRGEDIIFFCFHILKFLYDEEFRVKEHRKRTKTLSSSGNINSVNIVKSDFVDEEPPKEKEKEDSILECDADDSNDSVSNSSNCDIPMVDNFETTANATTPTSTPQGSCSNLAAINPITNRSPNTKRSKTSPISVPGAGTTRQRNESTSSIDSWHMVTETGSIDSTLNSSFLMRSQQQETTKPSALSRKKRLSAVRSVFLRTYGKAIGLKFKEGSYPCLSTLIGNISELTF